MEIYTYTRHAQFTGKIESHIGIKENNYFRPIINNHIMYGTRHTNVIESKKIEIDYAIFDSRNGKQINN